MAVLFQLPALCGIAMDSSGSLCASKDLSMGEALGALSFSRDKLCCTIAFIEHFESVTPVSYCQPPA